MDNETKTKVCRKCGRELPLDKFMQSNKTKDGYQHQCRECTIANMSNGHRTGKKPFNLYDYILGSEPTKLNPDLEGYTPRVLMSHLRAIGYQGELTLTLRVKL